MPPLALKITPNPLLVHALALLLGNQKTSARKLVLWNARRTAPSVGFDCLGFSTKAYRNQVVRNVFKELLGKLIQAVQLSFCELVLQSQSIFCPYLRSDRPIE